MIERDFDVNIEIVDNCLIFEVNYASCCACVLK